MEQVHHLVIMTKNSHSSEMIVESTPFISQSALGICFHSQASVVQGHSQIWKQVTTTFLCAIAAVSSNEGARTGALCVEQPLNVLA